MQTDHKGCIQQKESDDPHKRAGVQADVTAFIAGEMFSLLWICNESVINNSQNVR